MIFDRFRSSKKAKPVVEEAPMRLTHGASKASLRECSVDEFSDTWSAVSAWATAEFERARERNDSHKRDPLQTAALRERIATLKELLELPRPKERRTRYAEE